MQTAAIHTIGLANGKAGPHFASGLALVGTPLVSIVVPVYNERATIITVLERLTALPFAKEIVVVDDASTDGTRALLLESDDQFPLRTCLKPINEGKGAAIRTGLQFCQGDVVVIQDADLEYDPQDISRLVAAIRNGDADVVYGSRFLSAEGRAHRGVRGLHRWLNASLTWCSNCCTGLKLTDMETCYKAMRRETLEGISLQQNRFGFEPEITAKLARKRVRFLEVPVSYAPRGYCDGKKIMPIDLVKALYAIIRYGCFK